MLVTSRDLWNFGNHQGPLGHIKGLSQSTGEREREEGKENRSGEIRYPMEVFIYEVSCLWHIPTTGFV